MKRLIVTTLFALALSACGGDGEATVPVDVGGDDDCARIEARYLDATRAYDNAVEAVNAAGGLSAAPPDVVADMEAAERDLHDAQDEWATSFDECNQQEGASCSDC